MVEFLTGFAVLVGIYAVFALGLNIQWGYTGLFNIGVAGFFALGAYAAALLTIRPPLSAQGEDYLFSGDLARRMDAIPVIGALDLWFVAALAAAALAGGVAALFVGAITIRLRDDYLAIATLGIAESARLVFLNERWLSNGSRGLYTIPPVFEGVVEPQHYDRVFLAIVVVVFAALFCGVRTLLRSPWGRVLQAIREDEVTAEASGIPPALMTAAALQLPMIYAKKYVLPGPRRAVSREVASATKGFEYTIEIRRRVLDPGLRALVVDDFLAQGRTAAALGEIVEELGCVMLGAVFAVEKAWTGGRTRLEQRGWPVWSVINIASVEGGVIRFG